MGDPIRQTSPESLTPAAAVRTEVASLCDLLVLKPLPSRTVVRDRVRGALVACEQAGESGLIAHLLRNLLRDLAPRSAPVDAAYYADHLLRLGKQPDA